MKISGSELMQFLAAAADDGDEDGKRKAPIRPEMAARRLIDHFNDLSKVHTFKMGDLVQRKEGLCENLKWPEEGQPAIVTKICDPPVIASLERSSSNNFGKAHDISLMVMTDGGYPAEFLHDSRYFEPYKGKVEG